MRVARRAEITQVSGGPSEQDRRVLAAALEQVVEQEWQARCPSLWLRASRSQGRRLGMLDYRDRFTAADAWRLSTRFPVGGREYAGLIGRGDAR